MVLTTAASPRTSQTATSLIHERARFRRVRLTWTLVDEWGPAHNRSFRVKLLIVSSSKDTTEVFEGTGGSIKHAKQAAAALALNLSLLLEIKPVDNTPNPNKMIFANLLDGIPNPAGPRAEVQQLARVLHIQTKFSQVSSVLNRRILAPAAINSGKTLHQVVLHLAGRQYIGEATSRAGAEQEAALSALKALRRALHSLVATRTYASETKESLRFIQPNCASWRLRLLAALHFEQPSFKVSEVSTHELADVTSKCKRVFRCICSLRPYGTVEGLGPSKSAACSNASSLMLTRLLGNHTAPFDETPGRETDKINKTPRPVSHSKTEKLLQRDRADPSYGQYVHPVTRLELVCTSKDLDSPIYSLVEVDPSIKSSSNRPEFVFTVHVGSESVCGPAAGNKRLARRLAAESMLAHLGFGRPSSPVRSSVLHVPGDPINHASPPTSKLDPDQPVDETQADLNRPADSPQQVRHVEFSCARDVLLFDDIGQGHRGRHFRGNTGRAHGSSKSFGSRSQKRVPQPHSKTTQNKSDSVIPDPSPHSTTIGHWSDSEEAQTVPPCSIRRSRSCSATYHSRSHLLSSNDGEQDVSFGCLSDPVIANRTDHPASSPSVKLMLLCQIAALRVQELEQDNIPGDLTNQLLAFCQRLQVPCQFVDVIANNNQQSQTEDRPSGNLEAHHTTLTIGTQPLYQPYSALVTENPGGLVVAQGSGSTRALARQNATLSALRQLSALVH